MMQDDAKKTEDNGVIGDLIKAIGWGVLLGSVLEPYQILLCNNNVNEAQKIEYYIILSDVNICIPFGESNSNRERERDLCVEMSLTNFIS